AARSSRSRTCSTRRTSAALAPRCATSPWRRLRRPAPARQLRRRPRLPPARGDSCAASPPPPVGDSDRASVGSGRGLAGARDTAARPTRTRPPGEFVCGAGVVSWVGSDFSSRPHHQPNEGGSDAPSPVAAPGLAPPPRAKRSLCCAQSSAPSSAAFLLGGGETRAAIARERREPLVVELRRRSALLPPRPCGNPRAA